MAAARSRVGKEWRRLAVARERSRQGSLAQQVVDKARSSSWQAARKVVLAQQAARQRTSAQARCGCSFSRFQSGFC
jgi:hypothetical protein